MRVAVLADIHDNLPALEAVLFDVDAARVDLIVLNGDIVTGPMPAETLELLESLGGRAVWVRGNADREVVNFYDGKRTPDLHPAAIAPPSTPPRRSPASSATGSPGREEAAALMRERATGYPGIDEFLAQNVLSVPSDATVLEAFRPQSAGRDITGAGQSQRAENRGDQPE